MDQLIKFTMYLFISYFLIKIVLASKRTKKNKKLIETVRAIDQEVLFFHHVEDMINTVKDEEFIEKAKVLKLWGFAIYQRYDEFDALLPTLRPEVLIHKNSIELNEDSFFYLYIAIGNILFNQNQLERRLALVQFMEKYPLQDQLCYQIGEHLEKYYQQQEDLGLGFFQQILDGEYEGVQYSRTMIGLYKSICNAMMAKIYQMQGDWVKYEECVPMLEQFKQVHIGQRWIKGLQLEEKPIEESQDEQISQDLSETMVMERLMEEPVEEDKK